MNDDAKIARIVRSIKKLTRKQKVSDKENKEQFYSSEEIHKLMELENGKGKNNDCVTKYTPEETALYQRMVNAINSQVDHNAVQKEKVKQLRLQRKIEKQNKTK